MMKLYDYERAPNPRRVKIFLAEKGVDAGVSQEESQRQDSCS